MKKPECIKRVFTEIDVDCDNYQGVGAAVDLELDPRSSNYDQEKVNKVFAWLKEHPTHSPSGAVLYPISGKSSLRKNWLSE